MKHGFGIAETLMAGMIISSLILGFVTMTTAINRSGKVSYQRSVAADLAEQIIEKQRYTIEQNWNNNRTVPAGLSTVGAGDWVNGVVSLPSAAVAIGGITYTTQMTVSSVIGSTVPPLRAVNSDGTVATPETDATPLYRLLDVTVTWTDGVSRSYKLDSVATNWREGML